MTASKHRFDRLRGLQLQRSGAQVTSDPAVDAVDMQRPATGGASCPIAQEVAALAAFMKSAHGYTQEDIDAVTAEVGVLGQRELIRDWRISLVSSNVDALMPEGLARRARLEFDRVVRGAVVDEADLAWRPEVVEVAIVRHAR